MCSKDAKCAPRCNSCLARTIMAHFQEPGRLEFPVLPGDPNEWGPHDGLKCDCRSARSRRMEHVYLCPPCFELSDPELARISWGWEGTLDVPVQCSECDNITTAAEAQWYCPCCTEPCIKVVHICEQSPSAMHLDPPVVATETCV